MYLSVTPHEDEDAVAVFSEMHDTRIDDGLFHWYDCQC